MTRNLRGHLGRVLGFGVLPAFSILATLVILPLIAHRFGAPAWASVALGQSVGAIAGIIVGLTWSVEGGNRVAAARGAERGAIYAQSAASQLIVFLLIAVPTVVIALVLAPEYKVETAVFALATTLNGFTASWYWSGVGRFVPLLINEGLVRLLSYAVTLIGILLGADLMFYAVATLVAGVLMIAANWWTAIVRPKVPLPANVLSAGWATVRREWFGTAARLVQSVYSFGGPSLFAVLAPSGLSVYSGAKTVQTAAINGLAAVPNAFVSWVGSSTGATKVRRMRRGAVIMAVIAGLVLVVVVVGGQWGLDYLFAGRLTLSLLDRVLLALAITLSFYVRAFQLLVVVPRGRARLVWRSTFLSSVVGLALYVVLVPLAGVTGGLLVPPAVSVGVLAFYALVLRTGDRGTAAVAADAGTSRRRARRGSARPVRPS